MGLFSAITGLVGNAYNNSKAYKAQQEAQRHADLSSEAAFNRSKYLMSHQDALQRQTQEWSDGRNSMSALRDEASAAGFNPLTALGIQKPQATGVGLGSVNPASTIGPAPALASQTLLAEIGGQLDNWTNTEEVAQQEEIAQIKKEMMLEELKDLKRRNNLPAHFGYSIPHVKSTAERVQETPAQNPDGTSSVQQPGIMEEAETVPLESVPLTNETRTGVKNGPEWTGLNPDAWEIGVSELVGSGIIHGTSYLGNKAAKEVKWWGDQIRNFEPPTLHLPKPKTRAPGPPTRY